MAAPQRTKKAKSRLAYWSLYTLNRQSFDPSIPVGRPAPALYIRPNEHIEHPSYDISRISFLDISPIITPRSGTLKHYIMDTGVRRDFISVPTFQVRVSVQVSGVVFSFRRIKNSATF